MKNYKRYFLLVFAGFSLASMAQNPKNELDNGMRIDNLKREDYVITGTVQGISNSNRLWLLFIPLGGSSKTKREQRAYRQAVQSCGCDGIIQPIYDENRFVIPLILINFSHRKTIVTGKGYRIKTDADKMSENTPIAHNGQPVSIPAQQIVEPVINYVIGDSVRFQNLVGEWVDGKIIDMDPNLATIQFRRKTGIDAKIKLRYSQFEPASGTIDQLNGVQLTTVNNGFNIGDKVEFKFKGEQTIGHITRITPNNAIVQFVKRSGKVSLIRLDFNKFVKKQ